MITTKQIRGNLLANLLNERALLAVLIVGQLLAVILCFSPLHAEQPWLILAPISLFIHGVSLSTLISLHLLKQQLHKASFAQQLAVIILLMCGFTIIASFMVYTILVIDTMSLVTFLLRNLLLSFIVAVLFAQFSVIHAERIATKQQATKAKLSSLQARIRPHFLYNSLNMAAELVHQNPEDAEKTILAIAALSRAAMYCDEDIPLNKELELTQQYVLVESWRFGKRLTVDWQLPQHIPEVSLPALTIQPLLENAICHGVEPHTEPSLVSVLMEVTNTSITLVIDNPLISSLGTKRPSNGIAVHNIRERLTMRFGSRAQLAHYKQDKIYRTKLVIPRVG